MRKLEDLCMRFGEHILFERLNFSFPAHGLVAVCGPSGSGKTTLLRIMAGLLQPQAGRVYGFDPAAICMVFQQPRLLPACSARQNVIAVLGEMPRAARGERADAMLSLFSAASFAHKRPDVLSGGEQQRVALARAFAPQCSVVLLDEPTASMDAPLRRQITSVLCDQAKDRLIVLATHSTEQIAVADYTLSL